MKFIMGKDNYQQIGLCVTLLLLAFICNAQSIVPQAVNSSGGILKQSNGSLSFTIGELAVFNLKDSQGNTLGEGFMSGATISTVINQVIDHSVLDLEVFPNPSLDVVNIRINNSTIDQLVISIFDLQGKEIYKVEYATFRNMINIDVSDLVAGTYVLYFKTRTDQLLGSYWIIKR